MSTIALRTFSPNFKPKLAIDFASETSCQEVDLYRVALQHPAPIVEELTGGIAQGGEDLSGAAREAPAEGNEVVLNCITSDAGTLVIEEGNETSGSLEWTGFEGFHLAACQSIGLRFRTSEPFYRVTFRAPEAEAVGAFHVLSQVRPLEV